MRKKLILLLAMILLSGCSGYIEYPFRSQSDWQPDKAVAEAQRDLKRGKAKFYYTGGIATLAPGVPYDHPLLTQLPKADAGASKGCLVSDESFFRTQMEYAQRYNAYVFTELTKSQDTTE